MINQSSATLSRRALPRRGLQVVRALERLTLDDIAATFARVFLGMTFLLSGLTKVDSDFNVTEAAVFLFEYEYQLPLLDPSLAAHLAAWLELVLPMLLFIGLGARVAALLLLGMTIVIQVFVYPDAWTTHLLWAACLGVIVLRGPGLLSLDAWLRRRASQSIT